MHDLGRCTAHNGKIYCWNKATKKITVIDEKDVEFKDFPECVIRALMDCEQEGNDAG
jgi:hypothetical protein